MKKPQSYTLLTLVTDLLSSLPFSATWGKKGSIFNNSISLSPTYNLNSFTLTSPETALLGTEIWVFFFFENSLFPLLIFLWTLTLQILCPERGKVATVVKDTQGKIHGSGILHGLVGSLPTASLVLL